MRKGSNVVRSTDTTCCNSLYEPTACRIRTLGSYRLWAERDTEERTIRGGSPCKCSGASAGKGRRPARCADCRNPRDPRQSGGGWGVLRRAEALLGWSGAPPGGGAGCRLPPPPPPLSDCMSPPRAAAAQWTRIYSRQPHFLQCSSR
jgi:hypothetical protein